MGSSTPNFSNNNLNSELNCWLAAAWASRHCQRQFHALPSTARRGGLCSQRAYGGGGKDLLLLLQSLECRAKVSQSRVGISKAIKAVRKYLPRNRIKIAREFWVDAKKKKNSFDTNTAHTPNNENNENNATRTTSAWNAVKAEAWKTLSGHVKRCRPRL